MRVYLSVYIIALDCIPEDIIDEKILKELRRVKWECLHNSATLSDKIHSLALVTWSGVGYILKRFFQSTYVKQQYLPLSAIFILTYWCSYIDGI